MTRAGAAIAILTALLLAGGCASVTGAASRTEAGSQAAMVHPPRGADHARALSSPRSSLAQNTLSNIDLAGSATGAGGSTTVPPPTSLSIPAIGVKTTLVDLGLNPDGTVAVPAQTAVAGWYDGGPRPGQPGPAVILGHVDSYVGPAVFFRLRDLRAGDAVVVVSVTQTETFVVNRTEMVSKQDFPSTDVFGPVPGAALRLVTCGGPFDHRLGSYEDNVVVFATLRSVAPIQVGT